jgi:hypothetical protein
MRSILLLMLAAGASAQTRWPNELTLWFPDGTGIEIHTETSGGNAPLSTTGSAAAWANDSHRVVLGKNGEVLFAYDIEARRSRDGGFLMWIKPSQDASRLYGRTVPTISAVRDFSPLKVGDAVQVDILYNPATKEKIYDVLRVLGTRPPDSASKLSRPEFVLQDVAVTIDGKRLIKRGGNRMSGRALKIELPERGIFYFTFPPAPNFPDFQPSAWVDHDTLRFHAGSELIEVTSAANIVPAVDYGTVWVHGEPESERTMRLRQQRAELIKHYTPQHPDVLAFDSMMNRMQISMGVKFQCADDVESLLKRKEVIMDTPLLPLK